MPKALVFYLIPCYLIPAFEDKFPNQTLTWTFEFIRSTQPQCDSLRCIITRWLVRHKVHNWIIGPFTFNEARKLNACDSSRTRTPCRTRTCACFGATASTPSIRWRTWTRSHAYTRRTPCASLHIARHRQNVRQLGLARHRYIVGQEHPRAETLQYSAICR